MSIDYQKLEATPRLLMEVRLKPLQGHRFQPTGFADLGPARYTLPDGTEMLIVESVQSVANRMELACWDEARDDLIKELKGLPYVRVDCGTLGKTNTINEFHRLNSPYIWSGDETESAKRFKEAFVSHAGLPPAILKKKGKGKQEDSDDGESVSGILDLRKLCAAVFKFDPNAVIHGVFLEKLAGRLRMQRLLSGFIEARDVKPAESGGVKNDRVNPSGDAKQGFGNVPFHRTEFVAEEIRAYFNLDLALLRGYGLPSMATRLLIALSLFKIRRFLSTGLRLRTACDLEMEGALTVMRPHEGFEVPAEEALLEQCKMTIAECKSLFPEPPITEVEWKQGKKKDKSAKSADEIDTGELETDESGGDE